MSVFLTYRQPRTTYLLYATVIFLSGSCKEKYALPKTVTDKNYLVVEGFINTGNDSTHITLSRTVKVDTNYVNPEPNAIVSIEAENGGSYSLHETQPGSYSCPSGPFAGPGKYRIHIETSAGKTYMSDYAEVKHTPPIDSVNWNRLDNGVNIFVNTHDPENNSRYYIWQFEESWEFYSYAWSSYKYENAAMTIRDSAELIYRCWQFNNSRNLLLGSSAKLSEDVIYRYPITTVENASWKISFLYSILVKQRTLDKGAFEYLEKMKKNSEQLGSIFDPQPTTSTGNIHAVTDAEEPVIGYMYCSTVEEKRIFISRSDVSPWRFRLDCDENVVPADSLEFYFGGSPARRIPISRGQNGSFSASSTFCMDCTKRGTNRKPNYWP